MFVHSNNVSSEELPALRVDKALSGVSRDDFIPVLRIQSLGDRCKEKGESELRDDEPQFQELNISLPRMRVNSTQALPLTARFLPKQPRCPLENGKLGPALASNSPSRIQRSGMNCLPEPPFQYPTRRPVSSRFSSSDFVRLIALEFPVPSLHVGRSVSSHWNADGVIMMLPLGTW